MPLFKGRSSLLEVQNQALPPAHCIGSIVQETAAEIDQGIAAADQLGPAGCVVTHRKEPPLRQHYHVQSVFDTSMPP